MTSASTPDHLNNSADEPKSQFQKTVENDLRSIQLAVAGYTFGGEQAMRVFSSAPILKRYDAFTLETTDGICVIIKGLINKAHTLENGFPSDVFQHFVFGFPLYWKEYAEKCMRKESSSGNTMGLNPVLEKLSPGRETMETEQPHEDGGEKDLRSPSTMDTNYMQKSKKTKPSAVPLPEKSHSVITGSEDKSTMPCTSLGGVENQSYAGGSTVEDNTTLVSPSNFRKSTTKSLTPSSFGQKIITTAVNNEDVYDFQVNDSGGSLSACRLYRRSKSKKVADNLREKMLDKKDMDKSLPEEILSRTGCRTTTRSMSRLRMIQNESQTSHGISGCQKIRPNSLSSKDCNKIELAPHDNEPGFSNNLHFEVPRLDESIERISSLELDSGSFKDKFEQISETPDQDKDLRRVKTKGRMKKAKKKPPSSPNTPINAENEKENISLSAEVPYVNSRRKLAYETPEREKETVSNDSPQPTSFKRSRSGRLLMPTLQFWRNQRAIYDMDRTITGIEEGILPEQPRKGSASISRRKRRKPL